MTLDASATVFVGSAPRGLLVDPVVAAVMPDVGFAGCLDAVDVDGISKWHPHNDPCASES